MHRVVCGRLVGDRIGLDPALDQLGQDFRRVAEQGNRLGFTGCRVSGDARQGIIQIIGLLIDIARAQAEIDAALLAFDIERTGTGETRRQRLCAAHAAQACSEYPFPFQ